MRRTETEVKEVRIIDTLGPKGKEPGTGQRRRAGCPCPGLGSCVGWDMNEGSRGVLAALLWRVVASSLPQFRSGLQPHDVATLAHRRQHLRP